jgi:hypothetical protein
MAYRQLREMECGGSPCHGRPIPSAVPKIRLELGRFWSLRAIPSAFMCAPDSIPALVTVCRDFASYCRWGSSDIPRNLGQRIAAMDSQKNLFSLVHAQSTWRGLPVIRPPRLHLATEHHGDTSATAADLMAMSLCFIPFERRLLANFRCSLVN